MRWTDGERGPSFKKSEINRHLPKIEVRHMRKASDPKAPSPLPSFVVRTYQLGSLEFLPLSSTLSAADARRRRPFAHLLKVSWVLSGSSWSTKMDSVRVSNTLIRENYSLVYFTNIFPVSTHLSKPQKHYSPPPVSRVSCLTCLVSRAHARAGLHAGLDGSIARRSRAPFASCLSKGR